MFLKIDNPLILRRGLGEMNLYVSISTSFGMKESSFCDDSLEDSAS